MKDYSYNDLQQMQKDASEEAFRMKNNSVFHDKDYEKYKCKCRFEKAEQNCYLSQNGNKCQKSNSGIDEDKLLILALIMLISRNNGDKMLMFALLYIIM